MLFPITTEPSSATALGVAPGISSVTGSSTSPLSSLQSHVLPGPPSGRRPSPTTHVKEREAPKYSALESVLFAIDLQPELSFQIIGQDPCPDRKSTRLNSSHVAISYAVFCLKKKKKQHQNTLICSSQSQWTQHHSEL